MYPRISGSRFGFLEDKQKGGAPGYALLALV